MERGELKKRVQAWAERWREECPQVGVVRCLTEAVNLLWLNTRSVSRCRVFIEVNEEASGDKSWRLHGKGQHPLGFRRLPPPSPLQVSAPGLKGIEAGGGWVGGGGGASFPLRAFVLTLTQTC